VLHIRVPPGRQPGTAGKNINFSSRAFYVEKSDKMKMGKKLTDFRVTFLLN